MKRLALLLCLCAALASPLAAKQDDDRLEPLFDRLLATRDPVEAKAVEQNIWRLWMEHESPTAKVLITSAMKAMEGGEPDRAHEILTALVDVAPDFAEGWNKRATIRYMTGNYPGSVADIERTLALEPRHFGALAGLSMIMEQLNNLKEAARAFERALAVNPHLPGGRQRLDELKRRAQGSPI
jgi:tetratricopeptide (TPR) repeat protein